MKKLSRWIYRFLPVYIPSTRAYSPKLHLAIWCCVDCKKSSKLWEVLKGTRITLRKNNNPIWVINKGEI